MGATAKSFVGLWQGEHQAGFAKVTIDLRLAGKALNGTWMMEAGAQSDRPFPAIRIPIVNPKLNGDTLTFIATNSPTTMGIRLTGDSEAIFEPILDPSQFDMTAPATIKAIEGHQVILRKTC